MIRGKLYSCSVTMKRYNRSMLIQCMLYATGEILETGVTMEQVGRLAILKKEFKMAVPPTTAAQTAEWLCGFLDVRPAADVPARDADAWAKNGGDAALAQLVIVGLNDKDNDTAPRRCPKLFGVSAVESESAKEEFACRLLQKCARSIVAKRELRVRGERKAAAQFIQRVLRGHFGRLVRDRWKRIVKRHERVKAKFRRARQERRRTMVDRKLASFKAGSYSIPKQKGVSDF